MTEQDFWDKWAEVAPEFELKAAYGTELPVIRSKKAWPYLKDSSDTDGVPSCPVCEVANALGTRPAWESRWRLTAGLAAEAIGLPEDFTFQIVRAADGEPGPVRDKLLSYMSKP